MSLDYAISNNSNEQKITLFNDVPIAVALELFNVFAALTSEHQLLLLLLALGQLFMVGVFQLFYTVSVSECVEGVLG